MGQHSEMNCLAIPSNLGKLLNFLDDTCKKAKLADEAAFATRLAGEEACSNIINHAYSGVEPGPISIRVSWDDMQVVILIEDNAALFSPSSAPAPDLSANLEDRCEGGLGWHLIYKVMDVVHHEQRAVGGNRLKMIKLLQTIKKFNVGGLANGDTDRTVCTRNRNQN